MRYINIKHFHFFPVDSAKYFYNYIELSPCTRIPKKIEGATITAENTKNSTNMKI